MKKLYLLLLNVLCAFGSFAAITGIEKLYVIGSATPGGWDQNTAGKQQEMYEQPDGTWAWVGDLKEGELKFLVNDTHWQNCLTPEAAGTVVSTGIMYKVAHHLADAPGDPKFKMPAGTTGRHKIVIDLEAETMTITVGGDIVIPEPDEKPGSTSCFLLGDATAAGTDVTKAIEMTGVGEGKFIWTGTLKAGSFSFASKKEAGLNINPSADKTTADISDKQGVASTLSFKKNDNTFAVAEEGEYTITVNLSTMNMVIDRSILSIDNLNIIGGALEENGEWGAGYPNYPMMAVEDQPGVYTISKQLYSKANNGAAELKFRTGSDWERCFVLALDAQKNTMPEVGKEYKIFYRALNNNDVVGDNKFGITSACALKFTIDLNAMTLKVEEAGEIIIPVPDVNTLYVAGTSFSGEGSFIAMPAVEGENGVFRYEGEIKAGDFTFYNASDVAENISPEADTELAEGEVRLVYKKAGTPKFTVPEAGLYIITVNLNTMMMTVEKVIGTGNALVGVLASAVLVKGDAVSVAARDMTVESAAIYDMTGKCLNTIGRVAGDFILGDNLAKGLYVVKMVAGGQDATVKVLVK